MFGLGINGLWSARHGTFGPRVADRPDTDTRASGEMEQNAGHG